MDTDTDTLPLIFGVQELALVARGTHVKGFLTGCFMPFG